jgi:hypothetical protein
MRNRVREQRIQRFLDLTAGKMLDPDEEEQEHDQVH